MESGTILAIHTAPAARAPMEARERVRLEAGRGIADDRYGQNAGTFSDWPQDHELTLVESEAIDAVQAEYGLALLPGEIRRNLTTRGIALNDLVGRRFRVGGVLCEGTRRCEPCAHLEVVTGQGGLARLFAGRGGLRARVLEDGEIGIGDRVEEMGEAR